MNYLGNAFFPTVCPDMLHYNKNGWKELTYVTIATERIARKQTF